MADVAGTQLLGLGRKTEERIDLALGEERHWFDIWASDPVDVVNGIKPDIGRHAGQKYMRARAQGLDADTLALPTRPAVPAAVRPARKVRRS